MQETLEPDAPAEAPDGVSNFAGVALEAMPSAADPAVGVFRVPVLAATAESLLGYGHFVDDHRDELVEIVTWPRPGWRPIVPGTGNEGGVVRDRFEFRRQGELQLATNHAVGRSYVTGWFADPARARADREPAGPLTLYTHEANYHPDGGQIFWPLDGTPFLALLALPGDDVKLTDFRAFRCDGTRGLHIAPGVWHQPIFPLAPSATYVTAQGRVHACVSVSFLEEFGSYLALPMEHAADGT
jgi:hypothetical protein